MSINRIHEDHLDPDLHLWHEKENFEYDYDCVLDWLKDNEETGRWDWEKIDVCLTGKDADLEPWGKQGIEFICCDQSGISIRAHIAKTFAGDDVCLNLDPETEQSETLTDAAIEAYLEQAQEIVCGCSVPGEWDGGSWYLEESVDIEIPWVFADDNSGEINHAETGKKVIELFEAAIKPIQDEIVFADETLDMLAGWTDEANGTKTKCSAGNPGQYAAWRVAK